MLFPTPRPSSPTLLPYTTLFRSRPRLLLAAQDLDDDAVVPLDLLREGATVRCLADRAGRHRDHRTARLVRLELPEDRKSTRLNSRHLVISYAVFCLKKKTTPNTQ